MVFLGVGLEFLVLCHCEQAQSITKLAVIVVQSVAIQVNDVFCVPQNYFFIYLDPHANFRLLRMTQAFGLLPPPPCGPSPSKGGNNHLQLCRYSPKGENNPLRLRRTPPCWGRTKINSFTYRLSGGWRLTTIWIEIVRLFCVCIIRDPPTRGWRFIVNYLTRFKKGNYTPSAKPLPTRTL